MIGQSLTLGAFMCPLSTCLVHCSIGCVPDFKDRDTSSLSRSPWGRVKTFALSLALANLTYACSQGEHEFCVGRAELILVLTVFS